MGKELQEARRIEEDNERKRYCSVPFETRFSCLLFHTALAFTAEGHNSWYRRDDPILMASLQVLVLWQITTT